MAPSTLSIIFITGLLCLPPLALYFAWLGHINRRRQITVLLGSLDFLILIAGLSGFLLFGAALILTALQSNARYVFYADWEQLDQARQREQFAWLAIVLGYLVLLGAGIAWEMFARRSTLCLYNCERSDAEALIEASLQELGLHPTRFGNLWSHHQKLVEIQPSPAFHYVNVRIIVVDEQLAQEIEHEIRKRAKSISADSNALGGWFQLTALLMLTFILASLFLFIYLLTLIL